MKAKQENKKRRIPEALGNRACGVWLYVAVLTVNAAAHLALFFTYGMTVQSFLRLFLSFIFFIYPLCYLADVLWSLHPSIRRILSGEIAVNRKYYMNTVQKEVLRDALLPVTVSIPVYTESNEIIFNTFLNSQAAARRYHEFGGAKAGDAAGYRPGYVEGYDRGFSAAPGMVMNAASVDSHSGSLSGNYAVGEGPTAAYSEKDVFFLLNGDILRMDAATGRTALLKKGGGAVSLQYYQGALYCCTPEKILRLDPETRKEEIFCERGGRLFIFEDAFYLYDSAETHFLYRISDSGKNLTQISGAAEYRSLNVVGGKLYFIDPDQGGGICCIDLEGDEIGLISSSPYESFCVYDGKLYAGTDYGLIRMDLNGGNPEILTSLPASCPNASDGGIFYIAGRDRTLEWMSLDGRIRFTVVTTPTSSFQVAGKWIFYQNEDDGGRLWKVRVSGADKGRAAG